MRTSFFAALLFVAGITGANAQALIIDDGYVADPPAVVVPAAPIVGTGIIVVRRRAPVVVERPSVLVAPAPVVVAPRVLLRILLLTKHSIAADQFA
jgi:hypothetical protein